MKIRSQEITILKTKKEKYNDLNKKIKKPNSRTVRKRIRTTEKSKKSKKLIKKENVNKVSEKHKFNKKERI